MSKQILSDDLLKEAVAKAFDMEAAAYKKMAEQAEEHQFSTEYREKLQELSKERPDSKKHKIVKFSRKSIWMRIAVVAVLVMAMGATVLAVEPLRIKAYRMMEKLFPDHTDVTFEEIKEEMNSQAKEFNPGDYPRKLKKVPEGYTLVNEEENVKLFSIMQIYLNEKEQDIVYQQVPIDYSNGWTITSDGTKAKELQVCGKKAYLFTDENKYHTIVFVKDGFSYLLGGYEEVDDLVACLESVFEEE